MREERAATENRIKKMDFNYVFSKMDGRATIDPDVEAATRMRSKNDLTLKKGLRQLSLSFVMAKLTDENLSVEDDDALPAQIEKECTNRNKLTWSKMFM